MKANGSCIKCGSVCFEMATTQECSNASCSNYSSEFADSCVTKLSVIEEGPGTTENPCINMGDLGWLKNVDKDWRNDPSYSHYLTNTRISEGPPKPTPDMSYDEMVKAGYVGIYFNGH